MPYVNRGTTPFTRFRGLISGLSKSGKTFSLPTFIYGLHDYWSTDTDEQAAAIEHAAQRSMVVIVCPGETGAISLPPDSPHFTSYYEEITDRNSVITAEYSSQAITDFLALNTTVIKNKPDIIAWDGVHQLYSHVLNRASNGEFLAGLDMDKNDLGKTVQYRASKYYNRARHNFGEMLSYMYACQVPMFIATCGEKWEEVSTESERTDVNNKRYLWPDISGEMATKIVGMFDARVSARLERRCLHPNCEDSKSGTEHHVWQFLPRGDVVGVGIRGLVVGATRRAKPYIHQNAVYLDQLINSRR